MQGLNYIGNFSSSDSYSSSDSDSGYYSDDNTHPETNYYKMSKLTGEILSLISNQIQMILNKNQTYKNQIMNKNQTLNKART